MAGFGRLGFASHAPGPHFGPIPGPWGAQTNSEKSQKLLGKILNILKFLRPLWPKPLLRGPERYGSRGLGPGSESARLSEGSRNPGPTTWAPSGPTNARSLPPPRPPSVPRMLREERCQGPFFFGGGVYFLVFLFLSFVFSFFFVLLLLLFVSFFLCFFVFSFSVLSALFFFFFFFLCVLPFCFLFFFFFSIYCCFYFSCFLLFLKNSSVFSPLVFFWGGAHLGAPEKKEKQKEKHRKQVLFPDKCSSLSTRVPDPVCG